ncbi:MAG: VWA domain-containing protein [Solirubrobacterales bacterium]|nr:VWA domain-containing protein [Solirubrobacterales bacterium]
MGSSDRGRPGNPALYGGIEPASGPAGLAPRLIELAEELRAEELAVGTSELLDAFAALEQVGWTDRDEFFEALAATLAKSQEDRRVLELVFDRFFFRAAEREAVQRGVKEGPAREGAGDGEPELDFESLRERIRAALQDPASPEGQLRDLARLAIAAFGRQGEGSGVVGVDVQRIRRSLELRGEQAAAAEPDPDAVPRERLREFEAAVRRELERALIERTEALPPSRPLRELDRALPTGAAQDLAQVHRVVAQLRRRLATQGREARGRRSGAAIDFRRTMRRSLQTGGVPIELSYRPRRPRRPELFVLCDVSTSVTSASVFFLSVLHALHDSFRKLRSFVFVERISEVTEVFERERSFDAVSRAISSDAGVADVSGYTDYGRVWIEFLDRVVDDLDPRSTVIVLGDARTNGREPHAAAFGAIAERAGRTFWMNPEPKLYWNYGDSVMQVYEPHCNGVFECWTTKQLEGFVDAIADLRAVAPRRAAG